MKKLLALFITIAAVVSLSVISFNSPVVEASSATTTTYTLDSKGKLVATQDAYLPKLTFTSFGLKNPSDLVIDNEGYVYVSDTGNNRIVVIDSRTGEVVGNYAEKGEDNSNHAPNGLFITADRHLYVCYPTKKSVYIYDINDNFNILDVHSTPDSVLFANRDFKPLKVSVDTGGNMYIVGEGVNEGVIQLSIEGEFLGYFTSNKVNLSILDKIKYMFYSEEQQALLPSRNPIIFSNLFADDDGLIYTTTSYTENYTWVKKHNTAGLNQFDKYPLIAANDMTDIWVTPDKTVYAASSSGEIYVYTSQGEFIHKFGGGGTPSSPDIAGVFKKVSALAVDNENNIWVLDSTQEIIQTFEPTEYASTIYSAINAYFNSEYDKSIDLWSEVIKLNQMSNLAHNNIGLNYLATQEYELAMEHLEIANNREDYSEAYWEVRNIWIQSNLTWIVITLSCIGLVLFIVVKFDKKYGYLTPVRNIKEKVVNNKVVSNYLFMFTVCRHPEDGYYDLRVQKRGSFLGANMIMITLFVAYLLFITSQGFIYQTISVNQIDFYSVVFGFFAIILAVVVCNYLVTSITEGNGTLKEIYVSIMYAFAPLIISLVSIVILSHMVTLTEAFMLDAILIGGVLFTAFTILKGMQEIQGYDVKDLIKSVLLTCLFLVIMVVVLLIVFVLSQDLFNFLQLILKEAFS